MTAPEADSMDQLIEDCHDFPAALRTGHQELPLPRAAAPWSVTDAMQASVTDLDEYV